MSESMTFPPTGGIGDIVAVFGVRLLLDVGDDLGDFRLGHPRSLDTISFRCALREEEGVTLAG